MSWLPSRSPATDRSAHRTSRTMPLSDADVAASLSPNGLILRVVRGQRRAALKWPALVTVRLRACGTVFVHVRRQNGCRSRRAGVHGGHWHQGRLDGPVRRMVGPCQAGNISTPASPTISPWLQRVCEPALPGCRRWGDPCQGAVMAPVGCIISGIL